MASEFEVENFNHKFAQTILFVETWKQWVYCRGYVHNYSDIVLEYITPEGKTARKSVNMDKKEVTLSFCTPESRYYNFFERGEAIFFKRAPVRSMKQTITLDNGEMTATWVHTLPIQLQREIREGELPLNDRFTWLRILNNHKDLTFNEALNDVLSSEMASAAFGRHFMVSICPSTDTGLSLWYRTLPVGFVEEGKITVTKPLLKQEVLDILRRQDCKWEVVA